MLKRCVRGFVICFLFMVMLTAFAAPALAFDARSGNTVTVPASETVEGDLYLAGATIIIDGTVNGDVFAAGQTLTINGDVNGGVTLAGQTIVLNGDILNGARVAGQMVTLNGSIGRDMVVAASDAAINSQSSISGDLVLNAATARVNGRVEGNVIGSSGSVTISDGVGGNINITVDTLTLASGADIQGNVVYTSRNEVNIQSGARVGGTTTRHMPERERPGRDFWPVLVGVGIAWKFVSFLMIFLIGIIVILAFPRRLTLMSNAIHDSPWPTLGWGALILVATPIAAVIVMVTIIGLPLGLITLILYGIAIYLSQLPVGLLIGRLIIRQKRELESRGIMIGSIALGLFILFLLGLIPIGGWIVGLLTAVFGLGSLVTAHRGTDVHA